MMLESVVDICLQAGKKIMEIYNGEQVCSFFKKDNNTPVTSADLFSNDIIVTCLERLTPNVPILSEENASLLCLNNKTADCFWVVDPLDGTKEFLYRNSEFTVNVALVEFGIPILGVIYAPAIGVLYAAMNGQVWKMDINTRYRLQVSVYNFYPPVIVVSRFHNDLIRLRAYLMDFMDYKIITVGSSLKFCLVAEGVAQIYPRFSFINIWDIAAGHAIALAAGAIVNDWNGCALNYNNICLSFLHAGFCVSVP